MMNNQYKLYGAEFSLYSGKARSYLRKKNIPFKEINSSLWVYKRFIVPRTGVKYIPVVQTPDDAVYQDTTVIIDTLEQRFPEQSVYPDSPRQKLAALLLELYGDEWLLIPAMHYRWYYKKENYRFVISEFGRMLIPKWPGFMQRWLGEKVSLQFQGAVQKLGIHAHNRAAIEHSYMQLLSDLQTHFSRYDYLLGSRPSIADFGFIAPLYAHLYRDPYPGALMRKHAPAVAQWVERMMSSTPAQGGFLPNDEIPDTLIPILKRMANEQLPVLLDTDHRLARWRSGNPGEAIPRFIGQHEFVVEGIKAERVILPYSLWQFQRPVDFYQSLSPEQQCEAEQFLDRVGMSGKLKVEFQARMARKNNQLYFAAEPNGG